MKKTFLILISLVTGSICGLFAQEKLTLQEAIRLALEENYDIKLVANDLRIDENNVNIANAGMLPKITGDVSASAGIQNTTQTLLSGETRTSDGGHNSSQAYGANLDWTLFDGFRMFTRYDQLKENKKLGDAALKREVIATVYNVMSNYFSMAQQQQQLRSLKEAIDLSEFRLKTAENRYQIGRASKLEVLAARVDLNTDTTNLLRQQDTYRSTQIALNELLARDVNEQFSVTDSMSIRTDLQHEALAEQAAQHNPELQTAVINQRLAELNRKLVKGNRYPVVGISSSYTINRSSTELGFSTKSRGNNFNYAVGASLTIFNGFLQQRNEKNASIQVESAQISKEKAEKNIQANLRSAYQTYLVNLDLVNLEQKNLAIAKENMDITLDKFKLGSIAPLEFREAQRNYVDASARFTTAQYNAKIAEIELRQIAGILSPDY
ncbi:Outer membrane protein TolC [bacterium A37T11]|nr:Outer membrane protein TolC [bacterium A37T11]